MLYNFVLAIHVITQSGALQHEQSAQNICSTDVTHVFRLEDIFVPTSTKYVMD